MNHKLPARVAHVVDRKAAGQRPAFYDLVKFAVKKEAEINFDKAKKTRDSTSKPKATTHFCSSNKKAMLPSTQDTVWKRIKNNRSLSKLQEEVGIQEAMVQVAKTTG